jgi:endonuclease/exonuclease/phosphatase family metal-dependent hydrolase
MLKLLVAVLLVGAVLVGLFLWASAGWDGADRDTAGHVELRDLTGAGPAAPGKALTVVTWNVAFGGGAGKQPTERHARPDVLANLSKVASAVRAEAPDVVFLQEVDRPSDRSGGVDQLQVLQDTLGLPYACFATTWRLNYLPFPYWPPERHVGRVWSGQAILSRFPIVDCDRVPLPQPAEYAWWYNRFFLHRSLQVARVALAEGRELALVNVHLEAFSQPNREVQAERLATELARLDPALPLVLAGDFNAVPAGATKKNGYADEPETDFATDHTLAIVRTVPGLREAFDDASDVPEADTLTFPAEAPTRRLDYLFTRGLQAPASRRVVPEAAASDHRPIVATVPLP